MAVMTPPSPATPRASSLANSVPSADISNNGLSSLEEPLIAYTVIVAAPFVVKNTFLYSREPEPFSFNRWVNSIPLSPTFLFSSIVTFLSAFADTVKSPKVVISVISPVASSLTLSTLLSAALATRVTPPITGSIIQILNTKASTEEIIFLVLFFILLLSCLKAGDSSARKHSKIIFSRVLFYHIFYFL